MFKKLLATVLALFAAAVFAASADVNKASQAELEAVKGIGPSIAGKILDERKKGQFKDWTDLVDRVKGVGEGNAAKFSADGLTVNGTSFKGMAPAAKKDDKPAAAKTTAATPAAAPAASVAKADPKADAKAAKEAKKAAKAASAAEAKKAKEDKKAAKAAAVKASEPAPKK